MYTMFGSTSTHDSDRSTGIHWVVTHTKHTSRRVYHVPSTRAYGRCPLTVRARVCACVCEPAIVAIQRVRAPSERASACIYGSLRVSVACLGTSSELAGARACIVRASMCALIGAVIASQRVCTQSSACV